MYNRNYYLKSCMHIDKEKCIWFFKEEIQVIIGALHVVSYEMWKIEKYKKSESNKIQFACSIVDVKYVKDWFASLYNECKQKNYIFLSRDVEKRLLVASIALEKCTKHFEEYEVENLVQITKRELNSVFQDFKKLLPELERVG